MKIAFTILTWLTLLCWALAASLWWHSRDPEPGANMALMGLPVLGSIAVLTSVSAIAIGSRVTPKRSLFLFGYAINALTLILASAAAALG